VNTTPTGLAVALTAIVGGAVALQAPINSYLGRHVGTFQAAFLSFAIGTLALLVIASLAKGGLGGIGHATDVPWYYLTGGLLGVAYVSTVLVTVRTLGAGGVTAATIAGQLTLAVIIDQLGILHVAQKPITVARIVGIVLLAAGVYLIVRN
jgi:transporter family-2 protein